MDWYHISPRNDLHLIGLRGNMRPTVGHRRSPYVYLGSLEYIYEQYLRYCARGRYFLYKINTLGVTFDSTILPGDQVRTMKEIPPIQVTFIKRINK